MPCLPFSRARLLAVALLLTACENELSEPQFDFAVTFTCPSDKEAADELHLIMHREGCAGVPVYDQHLRPGQSAMPSEALPPGNYGFEAVALREGVLLAQGCAVARLPGTGITIELASDSCRTGGEPPTTQDAGVPAPGDPTTPSDPTPSNPEPDAGVVKSDAGTSIPEPPPPTPCTGESCACPGGCPAQSTCEAGTCRPITSGPSGCTAQRFEGRDYLFCGERTVWNVARRRCRAQGMGLVSIDSAAENEFVRERAGGVDRWIGANDLGNTDIIALGGLSLDLSNGIPLGDDASCTRVDGEVGEGHWYWSSKSSDVSNGQAFCAFADLDATSCTAAEAQYQNWQPEQPDNAGCGCVGVCLPGQDCAMLRANDGLWGDETCSVTYAAYVCEAP